MEKALFFRDDCRLHCHVFYLWNKVNSANQKCKVEEYQRESFIKKKHITTVAFLDDRGLAWYRVGVDVRGKASGTLTGEALLAAAKWGREIRLKCGEQQVEPSSTCTRIPNAEEPMDSFVIIGVGHKSVWMRLQHPWPETVTGLVPAGGPSPGSRAGGIHPGVVWLYVKDIMRDMRSSEWLATLKCKRLKP